MICDLAALSTLKEQNTSILLSKLRTRGDGYSHVYKMGVYVPPYVKKKEAYGADQTEKVGDFRAEITVKVVPLELIELGKSGCF